MFDYGFVYNFDFFFLIFKIDTQTHTFKLQFWIMIYLICEKKNLKNKENPNIFEYLS